MITILEFPTKLEEIKSYFISFIETAVKNDIKLIQNSYHNNDCLCLLSYSFGNIGEGYIDLFSKKFFSEYLKTMRDEDVTRTYCSGIVSGWDGKNSLRNFFLTNPDSKQHHVDAFYVAMWALGEQLRATYLSIGGK